MRSIAARARICNDAATFAVSAVNFFAPVNKTAGRKIRSRNDFDKFINRMSGFLISAIGRVKNLR
jgi:hypothetical protein